MPEIISDAIACPIDMDSSEHHILCCLIFVADQALYDLLLRFSMRRSEATRSHPIRVFEARVGLASLSVNLVPLMMANGRSL